MPYGRPDTSLTKLALGWGNVGSVEVGVNLAAVLQHHPNLTHVDLSIAIDRCEPVWAALMRLPNLQALSAWAFEHAERLLAAIAACPRLQALTLALDWRDLSGTRRRSRPAWCRWVSSTSCAVQAKQRPSRFTSWWKWTHRT